MKSPTAAHSESFSNTPTCLLRGAQQGNVQALDDLLEWFRPYVFAILLNSGLDADAARDVFQNVFIALLTNLTAFERERNGSFRKYLARIAKTKVIDYRRAQQKWRGMVDQDCNLSDFADADPNSGDPNPESMALASLVHRELENVLPAFSVTNQEAFRRVHLLGQDARMVRQELGMTPGAMYRTFSRIFRRLRMAIGDLAVEDDGAEPNAAQ